MQLTYTSILLVLAAFLLTAFHFYAEPLRWKQGYLAASKKWVVIRDLFMATALASYLLPFKLGIPIRVMLSARLLTMSVTDVGMIMAADAMVVLLVWCGVTAFVGGRGILALLPDVNAIWILPALLLGAIAVALCLTYSKKLARALGAFVISARNNPAKITMAVAIALVDVASYGPRHALLAMATGLDPSSWLAWAGAGILATFAGIASGMPMGVVGYDATLALLFAALGASPAQIAMVIALNRGMSFAAAALFGLPAAKRLGLGNGLRDLLRKLKEMSSV